MRSITISTACMVLFACTMTINMQQAQAAECMGSKGNLDIGAAGSEAEYAADVSYLFQDIRNGKTLPITVHNSNGMMVKYVFPGVKSLGVCKALLRKCRKREKWHKKVRAFCYQGGKPVKMF